MLLSLHAHLQIYLLSEHQMTVIQMENRQVITKKHVLPLALLICGSIKQRISILNSYLKLIYRNTPYIINTLLAFRIAGKSQRKLEVNVKNSKITTKPKSLRLIQNDTKGITKMFLLRFADNSIDHAQISYSFKYFIKTPSVFIRSISEHFSPLIWFKC